VLYADRGAYEYVPDPTTAVGAPGYAVVDPVRIEPNPMRARAEILFRTLRPGPLRVAIHDLGGRCVRTLRPGGFAEAGAQRLVLDARADDGRPLRAGVYFVRVSGPDGELSARILVLR
jgi:hypothetical protein